MFDYLVTATVPSGRRDTLLIEAADSQGAYHQLEGRGFRDIVLHVDDVGAASTRFTALHHGRISPADAVRLRGASGLKTTVFLIKRLYLQTIWIGGGAAAFLLIKWWTGRELGFLGVFAIGVLLYPLPVALWATAFSPTRKLDRLYEDYCWARWEEVLARAPALRGQVLDLEIDTREACALAGLGQVEEGKAKLLPHAHDPETPRWLYLLRMGEMYEAARRHDDALECFALAHQADPDNPTLTLSYAVSLLRNEKDPTHARKLIDSAEQKHLSELLVMMLPYVKGLWLLNTGDAEAAVRELERARDGLRTAAHWSAMVRLMIDNTQAYLALAVARTGDLRRATDLAGSVRARLEALKADRLLGKLEEAIGGPQARAAT